MKIFTTLFFSAASLLSISLLTAQNYPTYANETTNAAPIKWLRNYSNAVSASDSASKPIAILFTGTNWCPACMKLEKQVLNHPEFARAVGQKFVFLKAEFPDYSQESVAASPYKPLLDRYQVKVFPTLVIINSKGDLLYTVNYREGGPQTYTQEMLQKLNTTSKQDISNQ